MASVGELTAKITLNSSSFESRLAKAERSMGHFNKGLGNIGSGIGGVSNKLLGLTAVVTATGVAFGQSALNSFKSYEKSMTSLGIVAKYFKTDQDKAKKAAEELGEELLIGVSAGAESLQNLLKSGLNLKQAKDMMRRFTNEAMTGKSENISLADAVKNLSFAYATNNSQLGNLSGISENFEDIIKRGAKLMGKETAALTEAEREMAKYKGMIELTNITKGSAAAFTGTLIDEEAKLGFKMETLRKEVGGKLAPVMADFYKGIGGFLEAHSDKFISFAGSAAQGLADLGRSIGPVIEDVIKFAEENPELVKTIGKLTVGALAANVAIRGTNFLFGDLIKIGGGVLQLMLGLPGAVVGAQASFAGFAGFMKAVFLGPAGVFILIGAAWTALMVKFRNDMEEAEQGVNDSFRRLDKLNKKIAKTQGDFRNSKLGKESGALTISGTAAAKKAHAEGRDPRKAARAADLRNSISKLDNLAALSDRMTVQQFNTKIRFKKELLELANQGYASGARYIPTDRLAKVHRGEAIVSASEMRRNGGTSNKNVTMNIYNNSDARQGYWYLNRLLNVNA